MYGIFLLYMIAYNIFSYRKESIFISEAILIILVMLLLVYILLKGKFKIGSLGWMIIAFLIWSSITYYWSINQYLSIQKLKTVIQLGILSILLYNYFDTKDKIEKAIKVITISYIILSIYMVYVYGLHNLVYGDIAGRVGLEISQENVLGMSLASGSILCFYHGFYLNKRYYYISSIFLFIMSSFTGSRKALLMIIAGVFLLTIMKDRGTKLLKTISVLILFGIIGYWILSLPMFEIVLMRFNGYVGVGKMDNSSIMRLNMIRDGWRFFKSRPILGYGLDCFRMLAYGTYSHNNYIELLVGGGILSLILYYSMYIYSFARLYMLTYKFDKIATILIIILMIDIFTDVAAVSYYSKIVFINLALYFSYIKVIHE